MMASGKSWVAEGRCLADVAESRKKAQPENNKLQYWPKRFSVNRGDNEGGP